MSTGRIALVTGAGGPMGRAVAARLVAEGVAGLVLTDISARRLEETAATLRALPGAPRLVVQRADVTLAAEARAVAEAALAAFDQVDLLVNLVGGLRSRALYTPFLSMDETRWRQTFDLNLMGGFHLMQALVPGMIDRGFGRIVNVASIVFAGEKGQADYAAAKAAVASLTRSLAAEFAPHVTVNCVAPGLTNTSVTRNMPAAETARLVAGSFIPRLAEPEETAAAIAFFLRDEAAFVTGEILAVAGGIHPHL
ncbi:SDR family NAD(P)-dependent oxidoreductase [Pararhodobacter zhoushanensis]|uniref:SDR family oxidoreductase n=1 Tax=Pararhodobacter zhoushanensis TaxID=2479545 RepID=A0ABT3H576_9RHOB|nr:SDR family oxidoreductase [Pararhodobacter zhoushanensis]MCW1934964.1 SDR family oxidoreductase [Pararhodobacter zhoushanensis]